MGAIWNPYHLDRIGQNGTYLSEHGTDVFILSTYKYIHSWISMYLCMNIYKCVFYAHHDDTRSWMNTFVCTWCIQVHECKYMYGHSTDTSVQLYKHTSLPIRPDQPCYARESDLICTMYMHVYTCHMMYIHGIYNVIHCIHMYICCTWVLCIICRYHFSILHCIPASTGLVICMYYTIVQ